VRKQCFGTSFDILHFVSKLSVGIVGLPNVGKSTLFNALLQKQQAYVANFPFATIEPNVGVVPVPDRRLEFLAETVASQNSNLQLPIFNQFSNSNFQFKNEDKWPPIVPATVEFVDIAGLVKDAHKGEGLGNKFLHHIREVNAIVHVVRAFDDDSIVKAGSVNAKADFETIKTELELADLESLERREKKKGKDVSEELPLLAKKPFLVVLNVSESGLKNAAEIEGQFAREVDVSEDQVVAVSAKLEEQLSELGDEEAKAYLAEVGRRESGLERIVKKAFSTLKLITFLTAGPKEVRAWTLRRDETALRASSVIHTDFAKNFIKADTISFEDFISAGGWKKAREKGLVRQEGRDYIVKDGDVMEFKIGQ